jgi:hypothetical protein
LSQSLNCDRFKISVSVIECFNSAMFDQGSSVSDDSRCGTTNVWINFEDFFDAFWYNESWVKSSFNGKNDSLGYFESNGWWAELNKIRIYFDGFDSVLDLEDSAFRRESIDSTIVIRSVIKMKDTSNWTC